MKKIFLLFFTGLLLSWQGNAQHFEVATCSATVASNSYGPMNSVATAGANSRHASIYPLSQLMGIANGTVESVYFSRATTSGTLGGSPNFKIYFKETTLTDFGSGSLDWATEIASATLVYDSDPTANVGSTSGMVEFPLSTSFVYSGTQNLAVYLEYFNPLSNSSAINWYYEYGTPCVDTGNSTTSKHNTNTTGTLSPTLGTSNYRRPVIGFDVFVPCPVPENVQSVTSATGTADFSWDAEPNANNGYDWVIMDEGDDPFVDVPAFNGSVPSGTTTVHVTGLALSTSYDFYVRADCGVTDGQSAWAGPNTFDTPCAVVVAPWSEDFENGGDIPNCWSQGAANAEDWLFSNSPGSNHIGNNGTMLGSTISGGYFAWVDNSSPSSMGTTLESPFIDVSGLNNPMLSFFLISDNEGDSNGNVTFSVDVWDGTIWNEEVFLSNSNTESGGWEQINVFLSSLTITGPIQLRFIVDETNGSGFDDDVAIDDIEVKEAPTCPRPLDLTATNITANAADLGWTENGSAMAWDIEWGMKGFTPTGIPNITGTTTNPHTLGGLSALTEYDFYVRADCTGGDLSIWEGPFTFETLCTSQLSGTYTIGATGDYTTLSAAVDELNNCGVSGPVTFEVAAGSGPYNEQLIITEFMGASSTNTVTFNGNGETLTSATVTGSRSLFLLDGADYVTINNFNMVTISDTYNFVVQLTNNADHNSITNNTIDMSSTFSSTGTTNAGILVSGSLTSATAVTDSSGTDNTITGNTIIGGYYGINVNGQSATRSMNNVVSDNTVQDFYSYGISLRHNNNSVVANNDISRPNRAGISSVSTFYGIYLASGGEGNMVESNTLHTPFGGQTSTSTSANYGIYHTAQDAPMGNESLVINNSLHLTGNNGLIYALYNSSSDGVHYYHNTVSLDDANATAGTTRGFYQTTSASNIELKNNIFSITREGSGAKYCMYFNTPGSTITSDNNVLHMGSTSGTVGIGYSGSGQATLADWQAQTSGDMNSVDADPLFVNPLGGDFTPSNSAVNNIGVPVGVTVDITGNPRNATTPDPGAYEFTPPSCPQPADQTAINITANSADLDWTENGTTSNWEIEWGLTGFVPTETPNITGIVTKPYNLGGLDPLTEYDYYVRTNCGPGDESVWVGPYTFKTGCQGPLAGSYTVGATGDFATLSDAAYALNTCGISASVTFNVLPGSGPYEEQIILEEIVGASATNTIAINGNGETLTSATVTGSRSLILLDGADYTTIVNFNLVTISDTYNFVIQLTNNADHNVITNNTIDMASTFSSTATSNAGILVSGSLTSATAVTGSSGTDNVIAGNTIIGGYYGINVNGQSATRSLNNIITNNIIQDFYSFGISLRHNNNSVVANNDISRPTRNTVTTFNGIYFTSGGEGNTVASNIVHTPFGGITGTSTSANYGIYHSGVDATVGNENLMVNNLVHLTGNNGTAYGLYNNSSDGAYYYHNTVVQDDANATAGTTAGFYQTVAASNIEIKNNIFSITRAGSGDKHCLRFNTTSSAPNIISDNNVLYLNSSDGTNGIGRIGTANHSTLADWQTATSGDMSSVDADPIFANPLGGDFSPANPAVDNIGTPLGITADINGNPRSTTTPDAGAYEFTPPSCIQPSAIAATNITSNSADISWTENGTALEWEVEYGLEGYTQGSGTLIADNDGTLGVTLTLLTWNTSYDIYVRAICSVSDESDWTGPFTFTTACTTLPAPYTMDFEANMSAVPDCWGISSSSSSGWNFDTSPSASNSYAGNGGLGYFAYAEASSPFTPDITMTSPFIDISGVTSPKLEFYKYHYDANSSSTSVSNTLTVEVFDGAAWNVVHFDDNGDVNAWEKVEVDLTTLTITGDIQARFIVDALVGSNYYNDIGIDDVSFTGILPCADPSAIVISNITDSGADVTWTENGTATEWEIEYGPTGFTQGTGGTVVVDNDGTLGETLSGLSDNTPYDVYVRAICSSTDASSWIGPEAFTTLVTPCADPSAIVISNITDSGADVSWTENGTATEWEIEYGPTGFTQGTGGTVVVDNDGTLGETLSGLSDNTPYDVYVRAICSSTDASAWIGPEAFTTLVTPCADPSAIVISNITENSADVSWTENGTATEWEIEYGPTGFTQGTGGTVVVDNDGSLGETLSGLSDNSGYDVYVRAICSSTNASAWIGPEAFTTLVAPCPDPSDISISNITENSADVSWTENGTATEWEIEYGPTGFTQGTGGTVVVDNDGTLGETLSGLSDDTPYDVYVRAICSSTNASAWIGPEAFTTLVAPCPDPSDISISNITENSADVSWTENGTATEWEIEYGPTGFTQGTGGTVVVDNDGTLGETLSGLAEDTAYDVYVRAVCSTANTSGWAGPETFTTDESIGVNDHDFSGFTYYPNPMADVINISSENEKYELTIFNVIGQKMITHKMEANATTIDVSHLASGSYFMQVISDSGKTMFLKLIKE